jgi:hypothetical protein
MVGKKEMRKGRNDAINRRDEWIKETRRSKGEERVVMTNKERKSC